MEIYKPTTESSQSNIF